MGQATGARWWSLLIVDRAAAPPKITPRHVNDRHVLIGIFWVLCSVCQARPARELRVLDSQQDPEPFRLAEACD
jgi:hypothetical protein